MNNKWTKALFFSCILASGLSLMHQAAHANWRTEVEKRTECAATFCDKFGYDKCAGFYDSVGDAASSNPHCFASAIDGCTSDCTSDANCADLNPTACGS